MLNPSGMSPCDVKVLVRPDPVEETTKGGIILASTTQEKAKYAGTKATVIATGPNAFKEWGPENGPKPGDRVLYAQYSGARHKGLDGEDYVVLNDEDLIALIEVSQ